MGVGMEGNSGERKPAGGSGTERVTAVRCECGGEGGRQESETSTLVDQICQIIKPHTCLELQMPTRTTGVNSCHVSGR